MKQIIALHGGNAFDSYEKFVGWLHDFKIENINYFKAKKNNWKFSLEEELGVEYEVLLPIMPNKQNAKYSEWNIWFKRLYPFLQNEVVLIGHSLGATFLARFLAEEDFPVKIVGTFLVAGPYDVDDHRSGSEFALPSSLAKFERQGGNIFLYQSEDDPSVEYTALTKFKKAIPSSTTRAFKDRGHFNQETFPEIVEDIKSLAS